MPVSKMCAEEAGCSYSVDALLSNTTSGAGGMAAAAWLSVSTCLWEAASPRAFLAVLSSKAQRVLCRDGGRAAPSCISPHSSAFSLPARVVAAQEQGRWVQALLLSELLA